MITVEFDGTVTNADSWKSLLLQFAAEDLPFEIHCWEDEPDAIALALQYGQRRESSWRGGVIIGGVVTAQFRQMLAETAKPADDSAYNKQTPFFSIFLGNDFAAEHYGTENHILTELRPEWDRLLQQLAQTDGVTVSVS